MANDLSPLTESDMQTNRMYRVVLGMAVSLSPAILLAQDPATLPGSPQQAQQSQPNATANSLPLNQQDSSPAPGVTGQEMKDKIFIRKAAQGGLAEVKLGQLAADKGASDDVKTFGARMVADHTMLNNEMKPIADSMGIRLPKEMNKMDQAEYEKLSSLSGDSFDKEYITDMVKDHRKDLREFSAEATATQDSTLRASVEKAEGIIREHTHMIVKIAKTKGVMPQSAAPTASAPPPAQ